MHEVALAERIVQIAVEAAKKEGADHVASARVLVGELSCVEPESLSFAFEVATRGSLAEGCRLEIVRVPARFKCRSCGAEGGGDLLEPCPACHALERDVLAGRELRVESIDI